MKNKTTAAILAFLFGGLGIHRFYLGQIGFGLLNLIFFWTLIPSLIGLIDFIAFISMSKEKFDLKYNKPQNTICATCGIELTFKNKTKFGFGKLDDGSEMCAKCFKKLENTMQKIYHRVFREKTAQEEHDLWLKEHPEHVKQLDEQQKKES